MSLLNASGYWDILFNPYSSNDSFVNKGTGTNYGIDLTLEKFFSNQYYYMLTGTFFNSTYNPGNGKSYNTRYNGRYQLNALGGKEFKLRKNQVLGINAKLNLYGGNRYTPIDLEASRLKGETVLQLDKPFASQVGTYFRFDFGISYKVNKANVTHTVLFDIQNLTGRENKGGVYYDTITQNEEYWTLTGFFPFFNYRIEF